MLDTFPFDHELDSMCVVVSSEDERPRMAKSECLVPRTVLAPFKRKRGRPLKVRNVQNMEYFPQGDYYEQPLLVKSELWDSHTENPKRKLGRPCKTKSSESVPKMDNANGDPPNGNHQYLLWMDGSLNKRVSGRRPKVNVRERAFIKRGPRRPRKMGMRPPIESYEQIQSESRNYSTNNCNEVAEPHIVSQINSFCNKGPATQYNYGFGSSAKYVVRKMNGSHGVLRCKLCNFQTKVKFRLRRHLQTYHMQLLDESQVFECASCDYESCLKSCMARHVVKHLPENWLQCPECDFTEENSTKFYKHYLCHGKYKRKEYTCPFCMYKFRTWTHVARHVSYHRKYPDIYDCRKCDFSTTRPDHLERHKSLYHEIDEPENLKRSDMTYDFNNRENERYLDPKHTGVCVSTHLNKPHFPEGLKMALEDITAGRLSCSEAACQLPNKSTALEQSGNGQSVNLNDSITDFGLEKNCVGGSASPSAKRGRGRPRKIQVDTGGVVKRGRGRPTKFSSTTGTPCREKHPAASTCRPNADKIVPDACWPSLGNDPTKTLLERAKCSDIIDEMPSHHFMVEHLEDLGECNRSSEIQSHMPDTSYLPCLISS